MTDRARREPPVEAIQAGYWLTQTRRLLHGDQKFAGAPDEHASEFLDKAISYLRKAITIVYDDTNAGKGIVFMQQFGPGMRLVCEVADELYGIRGTIPMHQRQALGWKVAEGHNELRLLMRDLGYRTITDDDFAAYGDGGGR